MASFDYHARTQKALLWELVRVDKRTKPVFSGMTEEIDVRWVPRRREVVDGAGQKIVTEVTAAVDRRIPPGSLMWRGGLIDLAGTGTGTDNMPETGFMRVVTFNESEDIRGHGEQAYEVTLVRYSDSIGAIQQE